MTDSLTTIKIEPHGCPLHQFILLKQKPIPEIFANTYWELAKLKDSVFFECAILNLFFLLHPHENQSVSWVARMGRNFDDYPGFQPKTTPAQRYATQCMYLYSYLNYGCPRPGSDFRFEFNIGQLSKRPAPSDTIHEFPGIVNGTSDTFTINSGVVHRSEFVKNIYISCILGSIYVHCTAKWIWDSSILTSDCLLISVVLPVFAWCDHNIVLQIKTKQFYDHIMQKLIKTGKNTEINKQFYVKFWLNWTKFGVVSYWHLLSCNQLKLVNYLNLSLMTAQSAKGLPDMAMTLLTIDLDLGITAKRPALAAPAPGPNL